MKKNFMLARPAVEVATELRVPGSRERIVGANGELNASSKADLLVQIANLMELVGDGKIVTEGQMTEIAKATSQAKEHAELVQAAFDDKTEHAALGDLIADNLVQTMNRDGFARRFMRYQDLQTGQIASARMSVKNVTASIAVGPIQTATQIIRDNVFFPTEFYITARPFIERKDIERSSNDILEEKYVEALEAVMVAEDRTWKRMVDELIGLDNPHLNIAGQFTPAAFTELVGMVSDWGVAPGNMLIASDVWQDIISGGWSDVLAPEAQAEALLTGRLATIYGMSLMSDTFRHPTHKVLNQGEIYVIGAPNQHGQMTDRGGVDSEPISMSEERIPGRGWTMNELISMIIVNSRSVARGRRTK